MIVKSLCVGPVQTNCYIVACEATQQAAIIDPGSDAPQILQAVKELGVDVKIILLTHAHFDHMAAADAVSQATGASVAVTSEDLPLLNSGGLAMVFGLRPPPVPAVVPLAHDQEIPVGQLRLRVLFTPGHSPGHVSFHAVTEKVLFDGDLVFAGGVGRTDLPGADHNDMMTSVERVLALPDETRLYPGHGPATTVGQEKDSNPWF